MLIGAAGKTFQDLRRCVSAWEHGSKERMDWLGGTEVVAAIRPWKIATLDAEQRCATDPATGSWLTVSGHIFRESAEPKEVVPDGILNPVLKSLIRKGLDGLSEFDGSYAIAWFDGRSHRLYLIRDRFGIEPLFYAGIGDSILFASRVHDLLITGMLSGRLCPQGLAEYLTYCYIPSNATLDRDVRQVPAGSYIVIDPQRGLVGRGHWYHLSYRPSTELDTDSVRQQFRALLEQAVVRRMAAGRLGVFLSGGMDSSSVLTFARRNSAEQIHTLAFRCEAKSFDESRYARALSEALQTLHTEVEYGEQDTIQSESIVEEMDAPFCNVGINIGSWLLAKAAEGKIDYVLTGDGGDEFWGSHPVYTAQRLFSVYEQLPLSQVLQRILVRCAASIPDSDKKADFRVKLKRIFPSEGIPAEIRHFRWQSYYSPRDLECLLVPEMAAEVRQHDPFKCVVDAFDGYCGPDDGLSPLLYSDYITSSSYYFKRLRLVRRFGIEARCPFYDRALVEFSARIPAHLKVQGLGKTKVLFKNAMEGVLPDVIRLRKDKLGHSIPLKNWLRRNGPLAAQILAVCGSAAVEARGLFQPEVVARLIEEHRSRRQNHSHRLWAIYTLELWLRARERSRAIRSGVYATENQEP